MSFHRSRTAAYEHLSAGARAQIRRRLCDAGLSGLGAEQALTGHAVGSAADRAAIARLLARLAAAPPQAARFELYDWPGEYAQRFDGVD